MTTHTPGPWRPDTALNIDAGPNGTGAYICAVGHRGDAQAEADAKLIAAAPELYEALQQAQRVLAMFIDPKSIEQTTTLNAYAQAMEAETAARSALGKAAATPAPSSEDRR